jgi:hypothetical protein
LIVTIARKGYQFTVDVTVAEAADTAKRAAVQVWPPESSLADTQPVLGSPADVAVPKAPKRWRKAAVVGASAVLLVVVWWRFAGMKPPRSQKIMLGELAFVLRVIGAIWRRPSRCTLQMPLRRAGVRRPEFMLIPRGLAPAWTDTQP